MTTSTSSSTNSSSTKRDQQRQADRERLQHALEALYSSDGWAQWTRTRQAFRSYSVNNQLLIALQCPEATRVAGFRTWQGLGRQVRKGEKSIKILAPRTFVEKRADCENADESERRHLYFRAVSVFDLSQTEGDELPTICQPVQGDSHAEHIAALVAYAESTLGCTVSFRDIVGSAQGHANLKTREIVIDSTLDANAQLAVLVHELAHMGTADSGPVDYEKYSRADAEVVVEAVSMLVCASLNLDTSGSSIGYIAGWCARQDTSALREHAKLIDGLARALEDAALLVNGEGKQDRIEKPELIAA